MSSSNNEGNNEPGDNNGQSNEITNGGGLY
jgi:hypothetical protein